MNSKKRVRFAADVKDFEGKCEEYTGKYKHSSDKKILDMPANRRALYTGILKDRLHRMDFSYIDQQKRKKKSEKEILSPSQLGCKS